MQTCFGMYRHTSVCLCKPTACGGVLGEFRACRKTACLLELHWAELMSIGSRLVPSAMHMLITSNCPRVRDFRSTTKFSKPPDDKLTFVGLKGQFLGYKTLLEPIPATCKQGLAIYIQTGLVID